MDFDFGPAALGAHAVGSLHPSQQWRTCLPGWPSGPAAAKPVQAHMQAQVWGHQGSAWSKHGLMGGEGR